MQNLDTVDLFFTATAITGAQWPGASDMSATPPPTLQVISSISKASLAKEEEERRKSQRPGIDTNKVANKEDAEDITSVLSESRQA